MEHEADLDDLRRADPSGTSLLQVEIQRNPRATVIALTGEVDMLSADRMREAMFVELRHRPEVLVLDLTGVDFFPSTGISALALLQRAAQDDGVTLRVVATGRSVVRPLQITSLYDDLLIHPSRADALAAAGPET